MKKIAISQSNYIPWKGYFDLINSVDEFVLFDDMQYTKRDWRNRNTIKNSNGIQWLTIPVQNTGYRKNKQKINETIIVDSSWRKKHWNAILHNYSKAKYFSLYESIFKRLYLNSDEIYLSKINYNFITTINEILNIKTNIYWSNKFKLLNGKTEKLIGICKQLNSNIYVTGPAAKNYINRELFINNGIELKWMDYNNYNNYNQLYPPFIHSVSILDLLFSEGPNSKLFMKSF
tara:strand:+ start:740 stop:1435 length:696 start_codon:yes stop_codon:yes gene_type:complete